MKVKKNDLILILLLIFGMLSPIALIFNQGSVLGLAVISQAAPLAFAYTKLNGVEQYATRSFFSLKLKNGQIMKIENNQILFSKFPGFYYKKATYGAAILYGSEFIFRKQEPIVRSTLSVGLCKNGPMARLLNLKVEIESARLEIFEKDNGPGHWIREVSCD